MPLMKDLFQNLAQYQKGTLLDVRTAEEFKAGHIAGAINISHDLLGPQHIEALKKAGHLSVFCRRGGRAGVAASILKSMGIQDFTCFDQDGMEAWMEAGYPVQKD